MPTTTHHMICTVCQNRLEPNDYIREALALLSKHFHIAANRVREQLERVEKIPAAAREVDDRVQQRYRIQQTFADHYNRMNKLAADAQDKILTDYCSRSKPSDDHQEFYEYARETLRFLDKDLAAWSALED